MERECSSRFEEVRAVVNSVSAAVPAPAHQIRGEMKCSFSQFWWCVLVEADGRRGGMPHLVGDDGAGRCSCVGGDDDAILVYAAYDGCACAGGFGKRDTFGV